MSTYDKIEQSLKNICDECSYLNTEKCSRSQCNIGFSKFLLNYAKDNSAAVLEDGARLIPRDDFKYYSEELIADSIGEVCKLCKECRENHSEQCIISLCRRSLESTLLSEHIEYPGNILMYMVEVSKQNEGLANLIKTAYSRK